jgi:hypothetical protein
MKMYLVMDEVSGALAAARNGAWPGAAEAVFRDAPARSSRHGNDGEYFTRPAGARHCPRLGNGSGGEPAILILAGSARRNRS